MKLNRTILLGLAASAALAGITYAVPAGFSPQEGAAGGETDACQCTCAACLAKHGEKAEKAAAPAALPELPTDIEAEVAKALSAELSSVEEVLGLAVLTDVTEEAGEVIEIDLDDVTNGLEELASSGMVQERGYMGITLVPASSGPGAVIGSVAEGGPAAKAGLQPGDVITAAEEMPVESFEELIAVLSELKVGDTATVEVEREGAELKVSMKLASMASLEQALTLARPGSIRGIAELEEEVIVLGEAAEFEVADAVEIVLPEEVPALKGLGYLGGDDETDAKEPRIIRWVIETPEIEEVEAAEEVMEIELTESKGRQKRGARRNAKARGVDALPEGYVEIETRRVRKPAALDAALAERVEVLEAEVAELQRIVDQLAKELDRRNPR